MASRLQLKYGLVSEGDRLSNSADEILVTEATTGSKSRTKGSLYLIVTSRTLGGRARDATALVADTIRREYYYDESAGIAICLEKAIRSANRRLRHHREGHGLPPGSLGVALAVIRGTELYVATIGDAEAYLVRSARLLMPEHHAGEGLPAGDTLRVDVWRGDFAVGDSLILAARNVSEVVGTEELKNAVVTLHPQSAVEHLHHLFVAAGGEGSDALIALEAGEVAVSRVEHRLVPVAPSEPLAGAPLRSPIPLADHVTGAASAVQERAFAARAVARDTVSGVVDRFLGLMPRRRTSYRRITSVSQQREVQRRAAVAVLSLLGFVGVVGVGAWLWGGPLRGSDHPVAEVNTGETAFRAAEERVDEVFGEDDLLTADPERALDVLRAAWSDLDRAADAGVRPATLQPLRARVVAGLNSLYGVKTVSARRVFGFPGGGGDARSVVRGPDGAAYIADDGTRAVYRVGEGTPAGAPIIEAGQGSGVGIGTPSMLTVGGPDLVVLDIRGDVWRWRPSDQTGAGTLGQLQVAGDITWGDDIVDIGTLIVDPDEGRYNLYVADPSSGQILKYAMVLDGSGFSAPTEYLVTDSEEVAEWQEILVDGDIYAVTPEGVIKHVNGRREADFRLETPPDERELRPGHDYRLIAATGARGTGRLYVWDARHARIVVFDKADGSYVEQFITGPRVPRFQDVRGMYLVEQPANRPPVLYWLVADGLLASTLQDIAPPPGASPSPSPGASGLPSASPSPATQAVLPGVP